MYDGISVVSGTERQLYTAFGMEEVYSRNLTPKSKAVNLDSILKDIGRTAFFTQSPGDFEKFAQLWVDFDSPSYTQGDMVGNGIPIFIHNLLLMNECYEGKSFESYPSFLIHQSYFGYLNHLGEASGVACITLRDSNDPTFYYWFMSIMHDATGSPEERTVHLISNLPDREHKPLYHAEKCAELKPQKLKNRKALMSFLKSHLYSTQVYSLFERSLNKDCTFKEEQQELGTHDLLTDEAIKASPAVKAKESLWEKLDEARKQPDQDAPEAKALLVSDISDLRQSVYDIHQHGLEVSKKDAVKGQKIIDFSKALNAQAKKIANSNTEEEFLENKKTFETLHQQPKEEKGKHAIFWHRGKLKVLLANIGLVLIGVGLIAIPIKIIHGAVVEKRFLPFWGKTKSEELIDKAKTQTDKLAFKAKKN